MAQITRYPYTAQPIIVPRGAAVNVAIEKVEEQKQVKISTPVKGEEGLTVRVIPRSEWGSVDVIPPPEHWPFAFADIFTGTSFDDPGSTIGKAQKLGDDDFSDLDIGVDFKHLVDISDIHVRLTTQAGTGGQCTITFPNDLVRVEREGGGYFWKRQYFKHGRFYDGAYIQFLSDYRDPDTKNIWYRGKLKQTGGPGTVELDGRNYYIDWIDVNGDAGQIPSETVSGLDPNKIFAEEQGEPIFEPMQKVKIFMGNRFKPEVLKEYGYSFIGDGDIPHMRMPGHDVPLTDILDFAGTAAYEYATNVFTGYVSDVSSRQQSGRWTIALTIRDVTCWLDYSMLNVNPSLNIFGRDIITQAEMQNWQIFTTRFEGMPAHEVIRAIFLGLREARTLRDTLLYTSYSGQRQMVDPDNAPITLPGGSRVYVRGAFPTQDTTDPTYQQQKELSFSERAALLDESVSHNPYLLSRLTKVLRPVRYRVGTDLGVDGWINSQDMGEIYQSYLGIGNFSVSNDTGNAIYATPMSHRHVIELFAGDQLLIDPAEPNSIDAYVVQAYRRFFRQNWPLIQSEYATRRSIVNQVCKHSNSECYADGAGRVWFHPIRAYTPVEDPIYVIHPEETLSWEIALSDREIVTWAHVHGQFDFHIIPGDWIYNNEFSSLDMVKRFGVRAISLSNPNITNAAGARAYARAMLRRINANMITGRVTIILRPELQQARNVFIPWMNLIGYIAAIDHSAQWGRSATTTLSLKYVRHPWDPWYPLEYRAREEETDMDSPADDTTVSITRAAAGKQFDAGPETVEAAKPEITFTKLQGHNVQDPVRASYNRAVERSITPVVGDLFGQKPNLNIVRTTTGVTDDAVFADQRRQGLVIDLEVGHMGKVNSYSPDYEKVKGEAALTTIETAFRNTGFTVINMYDGSKNSALGGQKGEQSGSKGFLRLIYNKRTEE